jgi:hypothetical protein
MDLAVKVVGVTLICMGLLYLLKPGVGRALTKFFARGRRLYIGGIVRLALAILFLLSATECKYPWIIGAFGIVFLLGALVIFLAGPGRLRPMLTWFQGRSLAWGRIAGGIVLILGGVIVYAA